MKWMHVRFGRGFRVQHDHRRAQAASRVLPPSKMKCGTDNNPREADQWLYVVSGTGEAVVNSKAHSLKAGTLLLIDAGERLQIRNLGTSTLDTLNLQVPPVYENGRD